MMIFNNDRNIYQCQFTDIGQHCQTSKYNIGEYDSEGFILRCPTLKFNIERYYTLIFTDFLCYLVRFGISFSIISEQTCFAIAFKYFIISFTELIK